MNATSNFTSNYTCGPPITSFKWYLYPYNVSMFVLYSLVIIAALVANILVCIAVSINPKLRQSVASYFIVSLAISDIAAACFSMPFDLESYTTFAHWHHDEFLCNVWTTAYLITIPTSMWNLFILSIDRYRTLRNPWDKFRQTPFMTKKRAIITLGVLWIFSMLYALVPRMGWKYADSSLFTPNKCSGTRCIFNITPLYSILSSVFNFYLPMFSMCFIYYKVYQIARTQFVRSTPALELQSHVSNSPVIKPKRIQNDIVTHKSEEKRESRNESSEAGSGLFNVAVEVEEEKANRGEIPEKGHVLTDNNRWSDSSCHETKTDERQDDIVDSTKRTCTRHGLVENSTDMFQENINELICGHVIDKITEDEQNEGNTGHDDDEVKNEQLKNDSLDIIDDNEDNKDELKEKCDDSLYIEEERSLKITVLSSPLPTDEDNDGQHDVTDLPKETQSTTANGKLENTDVRLTMTELEVTDQEEVRGTNDGDNVSLPIDSTSTVTPPLLVQNESTSNATPPPLGHDESTNNATPAPFGHDGSTSNATPPLLVQNESTSNATPSPLGHDESTSNVTPPPLGHDGSTSSATPPPLVQNVANGDTETEVNFQAKTSEEVQQALQHKSKIDDKDRMKSASLDSLESTCTLQSTLPYQVNKIGHLSASRETLCNINSIDFITKRKKIFVKNKKAARTVSIIVGTFLICWLPHTTLSIIENLCMGKCFIGIQDRYILLYTRHASLLLGYLSAAINPIVYSYRNVEFRRSYRKMASRLLPCVKSLVTRSV